MDTKVYHPFRYIVPLNTFVNRESAQVKRVITATPENVNIKNTKILHTKVKLQPIME